jgi:hypothetical protein
VPAPTSLLINAVSSQLGKRTRPVRLGRNGQESLVAGLSEVPDPRDARGIRHQVPVVVGLSLELLTRSRESALIIEPRCRFAPYEGT